MNTYDYEQQQDDAEREMRVLQALMDVAAAGLHEQADALAGMSS